MLWLGMLWGCSSGFLTVGTTAEDAVRAVDGGGEATVQQTDAPTFSVWPSNPTTADDLHVRASDARPIAHLDITWRVDGAPVPGVTGDTVGAGLTHAGQTWTAIIRVPDGQFAGRVTSAQVTIGNTPGQVAVDLQPPSPSSLLDPLRCDVSVLDPDGAPIVEGIRWEVDGAPWTGALGVAPSMEVPSGELRAGQTWRCAADVRDGDAVVTAWSPARVVDDVDGTRLSPPEPWALQLDTTWPEAGDTLTATYTGVLAGKPGVELVVGFDGWVRQADGAEEVLTAESTRTYETAVPLLASGGGVSGTFTVPEGARSIHAYVRVDDIVDDNDGQQWGFAVGDAFPFIGPYLQYADDAQPDSGVVVSFATSAIERGVVVFGEWPYLDRYALGDELTSLHHVRLTDLLPDTTYAYRVLDGTGRASEIFTFRTVAEDRDELTFLVIADMQDARLDHRWPEIAAAAHAAEPDAEVVLAVGDLASDDYPGFWWRFFDGGRELFATTPLLPVIGNHDTPGTSSTDDPTSFLRYFTVPQNGDEADRYTVTVGPAHFVNLSTEHYQSVREGNSQYRWVEDEMLDILDGGTPRYPWVFASMHHAPYNAGGRFGGETTLYRPITQLFDGVVDWTFAGHEHLAQRFLPVHYGAELAASGGYGPTADDGVGYMVVPSAGSKLFSELLPEGGVASDNRDALAFPEPLAGDDTVPNEHGFVSVRLDGADIRVRTWGMGDDVIEAPLMILDQVSYTKTW